MVLIEQRRRVRSKPAVTLRNSDAKGGTLYTEPEHVPASVGVLGPVEFIRCPCGFTLAKYDSKVFWIRAKPGIREMLNAE